MLSRLLLLFQLASSKRRKKQFLNSLSPHVKSSAEYIFGASGLPKRPCRYQQGQVSQLRASIMSYYTSSTLLDYYGGSSSRYDSIYGSTLNTGANSYRLDTTKFSKEINLARGPCLAIYITMQYFHLCAIIWPLVLPMRTYTARLNLGH